MTTEQQTRSRQGVLLAIAAYTMWGFAPIYFKALGEVTPLEILSHRVIWSFGFLALLIHVSRRWRVVQSVLRNKKTLLVLISTAILVGVNWLVFIWAVNSDHMLDASLGYYINPLFNVLLGMLFLGERLRKLQWLAVVLALVGVAIQVIAFGSIPVIALILATSFGLYGLLRKKINLDAQTGLFIETLIMLPIAAFYLLFITTSPTADLSQNPMSLNILLIAAGLVTTLPLLCFNGAATRMMLSTLGFFQYIGPSLMFLLAVLVYNEPFSSDKATTFTFIWSALVLFSFDGIRHAKNRRKQ
ncbi:chloramphenicol resistance permease RarD [Vibrio sp. MACH09]|uniref:EamA family transporter RarD n=1 Tax=Vibrio sp. MACH09 TaxID=3025122 RepID=UPI002791E9FC|nr:EamA family transporter RarD [Vibrio sp. MACH09]GLO62324.1 chloramphenicol resistance permease RarD [Vibrio sp. MACH09]